MDQSKIAVRYGKAFFETAIENNIVNPINDDMKMVAALCNDQEIQYLLDTPAVRASDKIKAFVTVLDNKVNPMTINFIKMVIENKRESHLPAMCRNYSSRFHKHFNIKQAHLVTAVPIDTDLKEKINRIVSESLQAKVELTTSANDKLIGGFILRIDDKELDTSVATKLKKIKQRFIATSI